MRRIAIWVASTVTILVLLFAYHTSTNRAGGGTSSVSAPTGSGSSGSAGSTAAAKTYTGAVADTRWGPVQVKLTVQSHTITAVDVAVYPNGNPRDAQINAYALPTLVKETLQTQSAKIDMVSGATVTSDGYLQSLQSALDQAKI